MNFCTFHLVFALQTSHHQRPEIGKALKPLKMNETSLSLASDFTLVDEAGCVNTKAGTFYGATYGDNKVPVTLLLTDSDSELPPNKAQDPTAEDFEEEPKSAFSLCPVTKFIDDSIPSRLISCTRGKQILIYYFLRSVANLTAPQCKCQQQQ